MALAKISEDGQITIPKEILERLGAAPGDTLDLWFNSGYLMIRKVWGDWRDLGGIFAREGQRPVSIREMDEGILRFHKEDNERILRQSKKKKKA
jgi:AbrB family looped-hinge helix DNA binding protein